MSKPATVDRRQLAFHLRRWIYGIIAVAIVAALALPARGGVFCHMAKQAMSSCCCHTMAAAHATDLSCDVDETVSAHCCDRRWSKALPAGSMERLELGSISQPAPKALRAEPKLHRGQVAARLAATIAHVGAPRTARASPVRRGKQRARLGVTRC